MFKQLCAGNTPLWKDPKWVLPIHGVIAVMGNVRHPCRTRVSKVYFTQGPGKLKAEGIFAESLKKT